MHWLYQRSKDYLNMGRFIMNELQQLIFEHTQKNNRNAFFKYYIPKQLYDLFDYAIIQQGNVEFLTSNTNYKDIWSILQNKHYGRCKLNSIKFDENFKCYSVDVMCKELLDYIAFFHRHTCHMGEKRWKKGALKLGWSQEEVDIGYEEYYNEFWNI